jgi:hypothetical protein
MAMRVAALVYHGLCEILKRLEETLGRRLCRGLFGILSIRYTPAVPAPAIRPEAAGSAAWHARPVLRICVNHVTVTLAELRPWPLPWVGKCSAGSVGTPIRSSWASNRNNLNTFTD